MDDEPEVTRFKFNVYQDKTLVQTEDGQLGVAVCSPDDRPDLCKGVAVALLRALAHEVLPSNGPVRLGPLCECVGRGELRDGEHWTTLAIAALAVRVARHVHNSDVPMHISLGLENLVDALQADDAFWAEPEYVLPFDSPRGDPRGVRK